MEDVKQRVTQDENNGDAPRDSEINYRGLFEHNPEPGVVLDAEGRMITWNRAAQEMLGLSSDDLGTRVTEQQSLCLPFEENTSADEELARLFQNVQEGGITRWEFGLADKSRTLQARLSRLPEGTLKGGGFLLSALDVTERVRLERMRQELINMLVHDLRVPLGNIQNSLDLVLDAWQEQDVTLPIEQILKIGLRSAKRMERLISDILDSARLQAREKTLTVTAIDVKSLVEEAVETIAAQAERHEQTLRIRVAPDLPAMEGDADLLRRVLVNLLSNAVKYTQDGGDITLNVTLEETANAPAMFRFLIADNGRGISAAVQEHLFELFYRGDTTQVKGVGIGLAFCKLAVEAHGGRIWVESVPGVGSIFTFIVPQTLPKQSPYYQEPES